MSTYQYAGLTAHIQENEKNAERCIVLAEAIEALQCQIQHVFYNGNDYKNADCTVEFEHIYESGSEDYQFIYDNESVSYLDDSECPDDMPDAYKRPNISATVIKGIPMMRLYVPAIAKNKDMVNQYIYNALPTVLSQLFGDDLIHTQTKECTEFESFHDAKPRVLMSVNHQTPEPIAL